jgi:hypothetical protein
MPSGWKGRSRSLGHWVASCTVLTVDQLCVLHVSCTAPAAPPSPAALAAAVPCLSMCLCCLCQVDSSVSLLVGPRLSQVIVHAFPLMWHLCAPMSGLMQPTQLGYSEAEVWLRDDPRSLHRGESAVFRVVAWIRRMWLASAIDSIPAGSQVAVFVPSPVRMRGGYRFGNAGFPMAGTLCSSGSRVG